MAIDDRCLKTLINAGIHPDEAEDHLAGVQKRMEDYRRKGLSDNDAIENAVKDSLAEESMIIQRQRATSLMNLHKRMDIWNGTVNAVDKLRETRGSTITSAEDMYQSIRAILVGVNKPIAYGKVNLEADISGTNRNITGAFLREMADTKLSKLAFSGNIDKDIVKEIANAGSTKNAEAKKLAEIFKRYGDMSKSAVNKEGAWISDLKDYIARNEHDWEKISSDGYNKWKENALKWLDIDKTFAGMDKPRIEEFLQHTYNALVSGEFFVGGKIGLKDPMFTGPKNIAKSLSKERILHFTDDGWYEYWQKYGTSNSLAESIQNTIARGAKDSALMRWFGTNPEEEFKNLLTRLKQEFSSEEPEAVREFQDKYQRKLQNRFDQLSGRNNMPANKMASDIFQVARTFENIVHLGKVPFAHVSNIATRALDAHRWGDSVLSSIGDSLYSLVTSGHAATEEGKEILDLLGARNEAFIAHVTGPYNEGLTGFASTLNNLEMRATGISYMMAALRKGHEWSLSRFLGKNLDKSWEELEPRTASTLETYGVMKEHWDLLRNATEPTMLGDRKFLTPDMARRIGADDVKKELLERTLTNMFADSSRRGMNIPGAETKAILYRDLPFGGSFGKSILQFKQFPTELMLNAYGRAIYDNKTTGQRMLSTFGLAAALTVAGYIRMTLNNVSSGINPPDLTHPSTILEAAASGGAGMVFGDMLAGFIRQHQYDEAVASVVAGPVGKDIYDLGKMGFNGVFKHENQMQAIQEFGLHHIPFQNIWYLNLLTNYNYLWALHEMVHPGWSSRYEQSIEKDTGSKPFIGPVSK